MPIDRVQRDGTTLPPERYLNFRGGNVADHPSPDDPAHQSTDVSIPEYTIIGDGTTDNTSELNTWISNHAATGGTIRLRNCRIQQGQIDLRTQPARHLRIEIDGTLTFTQQNATFEHTGQVALIGLSGANVAVANGCGSAAQIAAPATDRARWGTNAKIDQQLNFGYLRIDTATPSGISQADIGSTIILSGSMLSQNNQPCTIIAVHFDEQSKWVVRVVGDTALLVQDGAVINWSMAGSPSRSGTGQLLNVQNCLRVTGVTLAPATQVGDVGVSGAWKHYLALWGHGTNPDCNGIFRIVGAKNANTVYIVHKLLTEGWYFNGKSTGPFVPDSVSLNWNEVIPLICGRFASSHEYRNLVIMNWPGIGILLDGAWELSAIYELENINITGPRPDGFQPNGYYGCIPIVSETTFEVWYHNCTFVGFNGAPLWYKETSKLEPAGVIHPVTTSFWFSVNGGSVSPPAFYGNNGFNAWHHFYKVNLNTGGVTFTCRLPAGSGASHIAFKGLGVEGINCPGIFNIETREISVTSLRVEDSFSADGVAGGYTVWSSYPIPQSLDGVFSKSLNFATDQGFAPTAGVDAFSDDSSKYGDKDDWILGGDPSGGVATAFAPRHYSLTESGRTDAFLQGVGSPGGPTINALATIPIPADPFDPITPWTSLHNFPPKGLDICKVRGPKGLMTAARLTASQPNMTFTLAFGLQASYNSVLNIGDMVIVGAWLRSADATKGVQPGDRTGNHLQLVSQGSPVAVFDNLLNVMSPVHDEVVRRAGGGWRHWVSIAKCTRAGGSGSVLNFNVGAVPRRPIEIDEPFLVVVPAAAGIPEDEVIRIYRHARYFRSGVPVGVAALGRYEQYGIGEDLQLGRDARTDPAQPAWQTAQPLDAGGFRVGGTRVVRSQDTDLVPDVVTMKNLDLPTLARQVQRLINIVKWHGLSKLAIDPRYIFSNLLWFVRGQDDLGNLAAVDAGDGTATAWTDLTGQNVLRAAQSGGTGARPKILAKGFGGKTFLEGDGTGKYFDCGSPTLGNLDQLTVFGVFLGQTGWDVPDFQNILGRGFVLDNSNSWQVVTRHGGGNFNGVLEGVAINNFRTTGAGTFSNGNSFDGKAHRFVYIRDNTQPTVKGTIAVSGVGQMVNETVAGQLQDVTSHVGIFADLDAAGSSVGDFAHLRIGELGLILGVPSIQELADYATYCASYYGSGV